jgi:S1-C subfamily serine protease
MTDDPTTDGVRHGPAQSVIHPHRAPARGASPVSPPRRVSITTALALCVMSALGGVAVTAGAAAVSAGADPSRGDPASGQDAMAAATAATTTSAAVFGVDDSSVVKEIAKAVGPAVVAIITGGNASDGSSGFELQGAGSGVIVDPGGLILTNRHVVGEGGSLTVYLDDGRQFEGKLEGVDTLTDLALLSIDAKGLPAATLGDSASVEVGELAVAIGNPEGDLPGSVTAGIVSALERDVVVGDAAGIQAPESLRHLIQHDAAINPGNSGGPLLGPEGTVIGINTAVSGGSQGIGFAIPIDLARPIVKQVLAGEDIRRPYIGIFFTEIDAQLAKDQDLPVSSGVIVGGDAQSGQPGIIAGGPAAKAGLKEGDILTAIDGQPIDATHQLDVALLAHEPGDTVALTVRRGDRTVERDVKLGIRPADVAQ